MSVDVNSLPPDVKAAIDAYIAQQVAAQTPAPPPEPTAEEKLESALTAIGNDLVAEKRLPSGSDTLHLHIYNLLVQLHDYVLKHVGNHAALAGDAVGSSDVSQG